MAHSRGNSSSDVPLLLFGNSSNVPLLR